MTPKEGERKMFWCVASEMQAAARKGEDIREFLEEITVIRDYTDDPAIRERCNDLLADHRRKENAARCAH